MITTSDVFDYQRQYCAYYHVLESDFIETEKYLSINPDNYAAYSDEFIKLIQAICSEIDVTLKYLCKLIDPTFNGSKFPDYKKCIISNNPFFSRANVSLVRVHNIMLAPWLMWGDFTDKEAVEFNFEWWKMYNKIKHDRTDIHPKTKRPYYKYANQGNTLNALAALYIVISYTLFSLCNSIPQQDATHFITEWRDSSKLFTSFLVAGIQ